MARGAILSATPIFVSPLAWPPSPPHPLQHWEALAEALESFFFAAALDGGGDGAGKAALPLAAAPQEITHGQPMTSDLPQQQQQSDEELDVRFRIVFYLFLLSLLLFFPSSL